MDQGQNTASYRRPSHLRRRISRISSFRPRLLMDRALYFTESMQSTEGQPLPLRWARALTHVLEHVPVDLTSDELLAGSFGPGRYGIFIPSSTTPSWKAKTLRRKTSSFPKATWISCATR